VSTRPRNERRLKLVAATALGLDALVFLVAAVIVLAVEGYGSAIFVYLVVICVLGCLGWLGLRWPGWAGGCLLPLAFVGFCFWAFVAAFAGVSLAWFLFYLAFWSFIPLIAGVLLLVARRKERHAEPVNTERPRLF
jgi:hypothetical protein